MKTTHTPPTIFVLSAKHETAARHLADGVKAHYPIGSTIRAKVRDGETPAWIEAAVEGYSWSLAYPCELRVRNKRTGKTRKVSAHPRSWNCVSLVALPENAQVHR